LIEMVQRLQYEPTLPELEKEWQQAKARWREAIKEFKEIISEVRSEIPNPDGALRIDRAALTQNTAYQRYSQAISELQGSIAGVRSIGTNRREFGTGGTGRVDQTLLDEAPCQSIR
jgi:hypothetical protein